MITLDVRNTFNSAPWDAINAVLRRKNMPEYIGNMLRSYMSGKVVLVPDGDNFETTRVSIGVPLGYVLNPT